MEERSQGVKTETCFLQSRAAFPKVPSPAGLPAPPPSRQRVLLEMAVVCRAPWLINGCLALPAE